MASVNNKANNRMLLREKSRVTVSLFCIMFLMHSCSLSPLDRSLKMAGKNKGELQKVLDHYSEFPVDSLKYKAACYLIENMPQYYSYTCKKNDRIKGEIYKLCLEKKCKPIDAIKILENKYGKPANDEYKITYDVQTIKADYLIDNIEYSFKVWRETPWGCKIPFNRFCEEILPYRVGNEPLEEWRELYYNTFRPILDSLLEVDNSVRACQLVYAELMKKEWLFEPELPLSSMGPKLLLKERFGDCLDRCELLVYALRSVGIPCGIDFLIQAPEKRNPFHYWNYMIDEKERCIDFALVDMIPDTIRQRAHYKRGKVYRNCYARQSDVRFLHQYVPAINNRDNIKDVSGSYYPNDRVDIPLENTKDKIQLNVFNNKDWVSIACVGVSDRMVTFNYLEPGIVYMLTRVDGEGHRKEQYIPFLYEGLGIYHFLWADTTQLCDIKLDRKYPLSERLELFQQRLLGGKFQGANKVDFSDVETLYEIKSIPNLNFQTLLMGDDSHPFRYFRYLSGVGGHCDMGEVEFISSITGLPLKGKVFGNSSSFANDSRIEKEALFDNDPLTYYSANDPDTAWVGMDVGSPVEIKEIRYIGRNDDNGIRRGDHYELFYFSEEGWKSLGMQIGEDNCLIYHNVPKGALFWLRNLTRGIEERIFTFENGKQVWW